MKAADLREMTREELRDKEVEFAQQLFNLRLQKVTGQLENPAKVSQTRRDLARVLTVLGERGGAESAPSTAGDDPAASDTATSDPAAAAPQTAEESA